MKTFLCAAALALSALGASAQTNYTDAVERQNRCTAEGELWAESWGKGTIFGKTMTQHTADAQAGVTDKAVVVRYITIFVSAPYQQKFANAQAAHMAGWAACMDRKPPTSVAPR